jgi:hypothetical protein
LYRSHQSGCQTLKVSRPVDWIAGDHIVVTTTDYLPNHSEELLICGVGDDHQAIQFTSDLVERICEGGTGVQWAHNGEQYSLSQLPKRLNITKTAAETRAAVGLLTHNIRIVSEGETPDSAFPDDYFFGGHTIVRVQGVPSPGCRVQSTRAGGKDGSLPDPLPSCAENAARHIREGFLDQ